MSEATVDEIRYWDREAGESKVEKIASEKSLRRLYGTRTGRLLTGLLLKRRFVNFLAGLHCSSPLSLDRVASFVKETGLSLDEYEDRTWSSFNDFFTRRFKPDARSFDTEPRRFPAFAEGRYLAFERVSPGQTYPVKGHDLTARAILADPDQCEAFIGGPVIIARLAPVDYHRFHYPDSGRHIGMVDIPGSLHSVNPIALRWKSEILATNHRRATYLTTNNFGRLAYVEIGALGVGKIVQTHDPEANFARGDEKGYFCYGGSTIIIFGQPGYWRPDDDLLAKTAEGVETFVRLGDGIATSTRRSAEAGKEVVLEGGRSVRVTRG